MEELKKKVIDAIDELNQKWVVKLKEGEKEGVNLTEMFGEFSTIIKKVDQAFRETEERKKVKKGILGW